MRLQRKHTQSIVGLALACICLCVPATSFAFSPSDLSGLQLWLKADALGLSDGAAVSSWTDSSGHGNNAVQVSAGAQPIFKTNILAGKPVIRFDGINDQLTETLPVSTTDYTVFTVARTSAVFGSFRIALAYGNGSGGTLWMGLFNATNEPSVSGSQIGNDLKSSGDPALNHIYEAIVSGGTLSGYLDGTSIGSGSISARGSNYLTIGSYSNNGLFWTDDIAEVIIYDAPLSGSDRQQVENYLIAKYTPDTTAPTVSMTAPLSGSTVKGSSVALTATASDNVGVAGVQFKLDGSTLLGSEITTAPYASTWDSTSVADGTHTLSATARDDAGNTTTSTVTVTVAQDRVIIVPAVHTGIRPILPQLYTPIPQPVPTPKPVPSFTKDLRFGVTDADIVLLQKYLNTHGYIIASFGPGSIGQENSYFGRMTRAALIKLQKSAGISPALGYFGSITREYINGHL